MDSDDVRVFQSRSEPRVAEDAFSCPGGTVCIDSQNPDNNFAAQLRIGSRIKLTRPRVWE